jgi:asparagine synthase (glutamine-hydrolysing)
MCGLAGRFHPEALAPDPAWAGRADRVLQHRGPDGAGRYTDERCELVHRRLALIDLSPRGAQPMTNEDGTLQVVFNGEIYNYRELRGDLLRRGHVFQSTSDTEVLLHLYEDHGPDLVGALRGIFAFAIYDRPRRRLLLARDRYGVKPLFYAQHGSEWLFASEIKAIVQRRGFTPQLDRQACYDFLGLGYVPEPATGFANIHALPAGSRITLGPGGAHLEGYDTVAAAPRADRRLEETVAALAERLVAAVRRQSVADVPVAALLSGGIDSSLVVATHERAGLGPTTTFNVRFPDRQHDETDAALAAATHYRTRHHTVDLADSALSPDALFGLLRHFDQPFADTSLVPMYWISRAVRDRGIICTLSGDGGDEVFGGYACFWRANHLMRAAALPGWLRSATRRVTGALAGWTENWGRQVNKALCLAEAGRSSSALLLAGLANYLNEDQKAELIRPEARDDLAPVYRLYEGDDPPAATDLEELSRRITERWFRVSLPSDMLRKVDMMSMRASIEVRVPLLDEEVVALGLELPHRLKTDGRTGKLVLRSLARRWLPRSVAAHPKHGFTIPLDVMVGGDVHAALDDVLLSPRARIRCAVDERLVRTWLHDFAGARSRNGSGGGAISRGGLYQRVFTLLALELWLGDHHLTW